MEYLGYSQECFCAKQTNKQNQKCAITPHITMTDRYRTDSFNFSTLIPTWYQSLSLKKERLNTGLMSMTTKESLAVFTILETSPL